MTTKDAVAKTMRRTRTKTRIRIRARMVRVKRTPNHSSNGKLNADGPAARPSKRVGDDEAVRECA